MSSESSLLNASAGFGKYEVLEELGKGVHATVFLCRNKEDGEKYAIKRSKFVRLVSRRELFERAIMKEISILKKIKHHNIVNIIEAFKIKTEIVVVLELLTGGELFAYISEKEIITEEEANYFSVQILRALSYLHSNKIAHLDLKPENIMLRDKIRKEAVIVDFSLSQEILPNVPVLTIQGTAEFAAPEIINYDAVGFYSDMWAFGVILYILLTGLSPFLGDSDTETISLAAKAEVNYDIKEFQMVSEPAINMLKNLIIKDKNKRLKADECLSHEWIRNSRKIDRRASTIDSTSLVRFVSSQKWKETITKVQTMLGVAYTFQKQQSPATNKDETKRVRSCDLLEQETMNKADSL